MFNKRFARTWARLVLAAISVFAMMSSYALDRPPRNPGGNAGFADLYDRSEDDGRCAVVVFNTGANTLYLPRDPQNANAQFNVLVWGNGVGGNTNTYRSVLTTVASQCIAIAASNSANSVSGREMGAALAELRRLAGQFILPNARVCTSGHAQGGTGAFNAVAFTDADCTIPVQPETRLSASIVAPVPADVENIVLTASGDTLATAGPNRPNIVAATTILTEITVEGEALFTITSGRGGRVGTMFRMASIAQLSNDPALRQEFRRAFFGPDNDNRADADNRNINDVRVNAAAEAVIP